MVNLPYFYCEMVKGKIYLHSPISAEIRYLILGSLGYLAHSLQGC